MATSIICCCAPIYRSIIPDLLHFGSISSWALQTFRSTGSPSKTAADTEANKSTHSASFKGSPKSAAKSRERSTGFSKYGAPWEQIDEGSSERDLAWTDVRVSDDEDALGKRGIPMRTVKIEQSVEVV
jgi:hypothetical protein